MNRVSRPNSAWNKSYDVKREVGETALPKVPMKRGPLSGDANFADLGSRFSRDLRESDVFQILKGFEGI